jgi:hypothetical protein
MPGPIDNQINNADQAIIKSYDHAAEAIRTTITNAAVDINVTAFTDSIKIGDGLGATVSITNVGGKQSLDVNVTDIAISHVSDSIRLGNGTDFLTTTAVSGKVALDVSVASGTINVVQAPAGGTVLLYSTLSLAPAITGTVVTYVVPANIYIQKLYLSGTAIGVYTLKINGVTQSIFRMSQTQYSTTVDFATNTAWGLSTVVGDIVTVTALNAGTSLSDFDVTLQNLLAV